MRRPVTKKVLVNNGFVIIRLRDCFRSWLSGLAFSKIPLFNHLLDLASGDSGRPKIIRSGVAIIGGPYGNLSSSGTQGGTFAVGGSRQFTTNHSEHP
jgi:hypothetical protein